MFPGYIPYDMLVTTLYSHLIHETDVSKIDMYTRLLFRLSGTSKIVAEYMSDHTLRRQLHFSDKLPIKIKKRLTLLDIRLNRLCSNQFNMPNFCTEISKIGCDLLINNIHNVEIVKLLLSDRRVDPSTKDNDAIKTASKNGHIKVVKLLLSDKRVDPSADNNYAIRWASYYGCAEVVKLLLSDKRVDPSTSNNLAIQWASSNGHTEVVKLLLSDKRVDPSFDNNLAIRCASEEGHTEVVKLLLNDKRVDPSANNNEAIRWASQDGHVEVVKLLLSDKRVDPSFNNNLAIRWTIARGHTEVVKLLLSDKRVDPGTKNDKITEIIVVNLLLYGVDLIRLLNRSKRSLYLLMLIIFTLKLIF